MHHCHARRHQLYGGNRRNFANKLTTASLQLVSDILDASMALRARSENCWKTSLITTSLTTHYVPILLKNINGTICSWIRKLAHAPERRSIQSHHLTKGQIDRGRFSGFIFKQAEFPLLYGDIKHLEGQSTDNTKTRNLNQRHNWVLAEDNLSSKAATIKVSVKKQSAVLGHENFPECITWRTSHLWRGSLSEERRCGDSEV